MHKRILSVLLVLAMVLSFVPVIPVTAAGTVAASPKAGTHTDAGHSDDCGLTTGWTEWTDAGSLPTEGQIVLKTNVQLPGEIVLTGDLTICLNGYVITAASNSRLFAVVADTELVITDCTAYEENGVYYAGALTDGLDQTKTGGGAVLVNEDAGLKLYDGKLTGNKAQHDSALGGAVALKAGAEFYMYGGELSDNKAVKVDGTTVRLGGAVYLTAESSFTMTGGTIKNNTGSGGAIYAKNAPVSISNALITGNTGNNGGAIYAEGPLTIADTVITGNTGKSNNTTYGYSAAVLNAGTNSKLTLSGKVVIAGNTMYGSVPDVSFTKATTDTLYIHNLTDGSHVVFATPASEVTDASEVIALGTNQTESWQSGWVRWLSAIDGTGTLKDVGLVDGTFVWGHYHGTQAYTALENADQLIAGGHYYLADHVQLTKLAKLDTRDTVLHLCLNGHDLTPAEGKQILYLTGNRNINVTIDDCTAWTDAAGEYHAGSLTGADHTENGGAISVGTTDTLNLLDGKITGNFGGSGGAIITYGTVNMSGGEISNNQAGTGSNKNGGGIYVNKNTGVLNMTGGEISGNKAKDGAGFYAGSAATIRLQDATFTGNIASLHGGAACISDGVDITLSGENQIITGNTAAGKTNNLHLVGSTVLALDNLSSASNIGVTLHDDRIAAGTMHFTDELANDPSASFSSDDSAYKVELVSKKLTLVENDVTPPPSSGHNHNGCNDAACSDHAQIPYEAWTDPNNLPSTTGDYYLDVDVTVSQTIEFGAGANQNINICLNGHTITQKADTNAQMYQTTETDSGVNISIADCKAETDAPGKITGFVMNNVTHGSVMYLRKGTTLTLFDGIFENNRTIGTSAGALMIDCTFNMYGGTFVNNNANDGSGNGGAIYLNRNSVATITGGTFKNNTGKQGGAIYMGRDAAHTFENVTFTGNTATDIGGALNIGGGEAIGVTVKNCTFENNTAPNKGGTIRVAGVARIEGCTITGSQGGLGAVHVTSGADLTLAGNNQITGNDGNLYLEAQEVINVESATGTVGVSAANPGRAFTTACDDLAAKFTSDDADYKVTYKDGKLWLETTFEHNHCICGDTSCTEHEQVPFLPWNNADSLPPSGNYCLLTDVMLSDVHSVKGDLTLCLHGKTITTSVEKGLIGLPNADVTLTITDCKAKTVDGVYTAGKLTGGVNPVDGGGGAIFVRAGSTLKLYQGIITDNKTLRDGGGGGAIMLQSKKNGMISSFYMYGGEISGNKACSADGTADRLGGGVYAYQHSVFVMEGGVIKNNEAGTGAGVYASNARLTISGEITGNTASTSGGGVYLTNGATVALVGAPSIIGNTAKDKASNLCLDGNQKIAVGTLDKTAKVAVSGQPLSFITEKCADYSANFLSDNAKYAIAYKDGALYLDAAGNHKHCFCAATSAQCDHTVQTFVEWDDPTGLPSSGNYYLSVDVELKGQRSLNASELNLCLNGHTIKVVGEDTRAFYTKGDATLRITDCTDKPGSITGGTRGAILTESEAESAALIELYNGIITGNSTTSVGGAILIQGASTFNMYGGKLTGNAHHSQLKLDKDGNPALDSKGNQTVTSERGGGALGVYGKHTTFNMYGGEISDNITTQVTYKLADGTSEVTGGYGGGMYVYYGTANLYGGKISNNKSDRSGGGIFSLYGTVNLENVDISGNYSGASGGAGYFSTGSTVNLKSGTVSGNSSKSSCGGMMINGKNTVFTMSGGAITGNKAGGSAGGVLVQSRAEMIMTGGKITNNYAKGSGGGMYISTKSKLTMTNGTITNNTAKSQAGGLMLNKATSTITNSSISYNTAVESGCGGVKMAGGTLTASGLRVIGNKSKSSGAGLVTASSTNTENGVKVNYYATCNLYGCTFADNESEGSAGGVLHQSKGTVANMYNCTFSGNKSGSNGGGAYVSTNVTATFKNCKFVGNEAVAAGGFRLNKCKVTMEDCVSYENTASGSGAGGMIAGVGTEATIKNLEVYSNTAGSAAGLLVQSKAQATLTDSRIFENVANKNGGGVYLGSGAQAELENVEIFKNEAGELAGGFYTGAGTKATISDTQIYENRAGTDGGGVLTGGDTTWTNVVIRDNAAKNNAGGIHTWKSGSTYNLSGLVATRMTDCEITGNTADGQGGGIYIHRGGPAELTNVTITGNKAGMEGGGIYSDGKMKLTDVTVTDNTSLAGKYAVYLTPVDTDGLSYYAGYKSLRGKVIISDNEGGDLYLDQGIPVVIEGTLADDSVISVTLSDGVLTQRVIGVYHYEGEGLTYTLTAGDRSITEPMAPVTQDADDQTDEAKAENTLLYVGVGVFVVAIIAVIALVLLKKKKAGKAAAEASQE